EVAEGTPIAVSVLFSYRTCRSLEVSAIHVSQCHHLHIGLFHERPPVSLPHPAGADDTHHDALARRHPPRCRKHTGRHNGWGRDGKATGSSTLDKFTTRYQRIRFFHDGVPKFEEGTDRQGVRMPI